MIDWKKRISPDEKFETLTKLTPRYLVLGAGILSAVLIAVAILIVYWIGTKFIASVNTQTIMAVSAQCVMISILFGLVIGTIATELECFFYRNRLRPFRSWYVWPWVYVFFSTSLIIIFSLLLTLIFNNNVLGKSLLRFFSFLTLDLLAWVALIIGVLVISFALANPLEYVWRWLYRLLLQTVSDVDYISIIEEKRFLNELRFRFDEARRYQIPLSLMVMRVSNYDYLSNLLGKRTMHKLQREVSEMIAEHLRHTDVIGILKDGQMRMILTYTPMKNTALIGERVREIVLQKEFHARDGQKVVMDVSFGVGCYTPDMHEPDELMKKANNAIGQVDVTETTVKIDMQRIVDGNN
ncbi:MAG: diguanylate cyclase [Elusimicrobiota bacterium]